MTGTESAQPGPAAGVRPCTGRGRLRPCGRRTVPLLCGVLLAALLLGAARVPQAQAFPPERRRSYENRAANEYLIVPAVASLPGIGVFAGVIGSGSNMADTGIDVGATLAESIDGSDISVRAVALREVPTGIPHFTFDYQLADITLGNFDVYLPGRDSPNFTIPVTARFDYQFVRPTLRFWERRVEISYSLAFFDGFDLDQQGNESTLRRHSAEAAVLVDLTDDVVDPRTGVRLAFRTTLPAPKSSLLGKDEGTSDVFGNEAELRIRNYKVTVYQPLAERIFLAWDTEYFQAVGDVPPDEVVSGGSPPLRGFPEGRWADRYGVFTGVEVRYLYPLFKDLDIILVHGVLEGIQVAVFYELGQVSPQNDSTLFESMHASYGGGVRALFEAIVLRFDLAGGSEGIQTHLTVGHAF